MSNSSLNINQGTNSAINFDLSGTINTQVVALGYGTLSTIGTLPTVTINTPNIGTIGTLGLGSVVVNTLPNLPGGSIVITTGTIPTLGTMGTLGTIQGLGTLPGVGVVTSITNGSINIPNGTIQALGTLGTIGTVSNLGSVTNLGQLYNAGTVQNQLAGTITALQNGTITAGSIIVTNGTIGAGTVSNNMLSGTLNVGTVVNNGGSVQLYDTSGSIANILTQAGTAAAWNSQLTAGAFMEKSGSATGAGGDIVAAFDASGYKWGLLQIGGTFVGTINVQVSNDNFTTIGTQFANNTNNVALAPSVNISSNNMYYFPVQGRYIRIRMASYTSGTANGILEMYTYPLSTPIVGGQISIGGGGNSIGNIGTIGTLGLGTITGNLGTMGTIGTVTNIGQVYNAGTLQAGTLQINQLPTQAVTAYGTMGTQASGTTFFTIQGTVGAGSEAIISDWSMVVMSGTCGISLSFGTNGGSFVQGTGVIGAGSFAAGGGLAQSVESALNSGTNGAIYAGLYGNGTAYYHVSYYKATTTV